jgi:hypothetical protein
MENKKWTDISSKEKTFLGVFVVVVVIILIIIFSSNPSDKKTIDSGTKYTATERVACRDFAKLYTGVQDGVLNDKEIREMAQKVYENAKFSDVLKEQSRELLSAITYGEIEKMKISFVNMTILCGDILK